MSKKKSNNWRIESDINQPHTVSYGREVKEFKNAREAIQNAIGEENTHFGPHSVDDLLEEIKNNPLRMLHLADHKEQDLTRVIAPEKQEIIWQ